MSLAARLPIALLFLSVAGGCVTKEDEATWGDADGDGFLAVLQGGDDCDDTLAGVHPGAAEITCDDHDNDCDAVTVDKPDFDEDGYTVCSDPADCDDDAAAVHPGAQETCRNDVDDDCDGRTDPEDAVDASTWYLDGDNDGYGDGDAPANACERPPGYAANPDDCDDGLDTVSPLAVEECDGVDNNCDDIVDGDDAIDRPTWFRDADGDGFGVDDATVVTCDDPEGYADVAGDCDDTNAAVHPGSTWYRDVDEDGYGDPALTVESCDTPAGYTILGTDCDDGDPAIRPGGGESCDGVDEDCDGTVDDDARDALTWYADTDGDTYGDAASRVSSCSEPSGYVADDTDCDDGASSTRPGAPEVCDTVDTDCDGEGADAESTDAPTWYADADGDGFGDDAAPEQACSAPPGTVAVAGDCDDTAPGAHPGAIDAWYDGVDTDCAGNSDYDQDGDGYDADLYGGDDCDDTDVARFPGSNTWTVPGDASTIQGAVDLACTRDEIQVAAGTYTENVDFGYKALDVSGEGLDVTTIVGRTYAPVVTMAGGSLSGFTVTGGASRDDGGGVRIEGASSALLSGLSIAENATSGDGGGVAIIDSGEVVLRECDIVGNEAGGDGGGVSFKDERVGAAFSLELEDVSVSGGHADGDAGGVFVNASTSVTFTSVQIGQARAPTNDALSMTGDLTWTGGNITGSPGGGVVAAVVGNVRLEEFVMNLTGGGFLVEGDLEASDVSFSAVSEVDPAVLTVSGHTMLTDATFLGNDVTAVLLAQAGFDLVRVDVRQSTVSADGVAVQLMGEGDVEHLVIAGVEGGSGLGLTATDTRDDTEIDHVTVVGCDQDGVIITALADYQYALAHVLAADNGQRGILQTDGHRIGLTWASLSGAGGAESSGLDLSASDRAAILSTVPEFVAYSASMPAWTWDLHLLPGSALVDVDATATDADGSYADIGAYGGAEADPDWYDDGDVDGMPDGWEILHDLDPSIDDAGDDADGDGLDNAEELAAGTDPEDADTDDDHSLDTEGSPLSTSLIADAEYQLVDSERSLDGFCALPDIDSDGADDLAVDFLKYDNGNYYTQIYFIDRLVSGTHPVNSGSNGPLFLTSNFACTQVGADFDGDFNGDIVVRDGSSLKIVEGPFVYSFSVSGASSSVGLGSLAEAEDVTRDGLADLVVASASYSDSYISAGAVFLYTELDRFLPSHASINTTDATLEIDGTAESAYFGTSIATGDLDGDGNPDIAATDTYSLYLFYGSLLPTGTVTSADADVITRTDLTLSTQPISTLSFGGDLDADGVDELVIRYDNGRGGGLYVLSNPADGSSLSDASQFIADAPWRGILEGPVETGDLDGDGLADLFVGASGVDSSDTILVFLGSSSLPSQRTADDAEFALYDGGRATRFGDDFQVGDFDGDGQSDIAAEIGVSSGYPGVEIFFGETF